MEERSTPSVPPCKAQKLKEKYPSEFIIHASPSSGSSDVRAQHLKPEHSEHQSLMQAQQDNGVRQSQRVGGTGESIAKKKLPFSI
jgi:hypothetical protein